MSEFECCSQIGGVLYKFDSFGDEVKKMDVGLCGLGGSWCTGYVHCHERALYFKSKLQWVYFVCLFSIVSVCLKCVHCVR